MTDSLRYGAEALAQQAQALADNAALFAAQAASTVAETGAHGGGGFLVTGLSVFVLACFVGYHVVWRVTPALHSPLMGITNAISSVIIVGAILATGALEGGLFDRALGFFAVMLASVNIFGGFMITHRMLHMFKKKGA